MEDATPSEYQPDVHTRLGQLLLSRYVDQLYPDYANNEEE